MVNKKLSEGIENMNKYTIYQNILDNARCTSSDFVCITKYTLNNETEKDAFISVKASITQENAKIIKEENNYPIYVFEMESYDFLHQTVNDSVMNSLFNSSVGHHYI